MEAGDESLQSVIDDSLSHEETTPFPVGLPGGRTGHRSILEEPLYAM